MVFLPQCVSSNRKDQLYTAASSDSGKGSFYSDFSVFIILVIFRSLRCCEPSFSFSADVSTSYETCFCPDKMSINNAWKSYSKQNI